MEILEAFDLVGTFRGAAVLAGCDHKTVATGASCAMGPAAGCRCAGAGAADGRSVRGEDRGVGGALARARSARTRRMSGWC